MARRCLTHRNRSRFAGGGTVRQPATKQQQQNQRRHMKETLTTGEVANRLWQDDNANWSYAGARALAEYLEDIEGDTGEEMEFDRVAIRCDFAEWESLQSWAVDYFGGTGEAVEALGLDPEDVDGREDTIREYIQDRGTLLEFDGGIIVSSF